MNVCGDERACHVQEKADDDLIGNVSGTASAPQAETSDVDSQLEELFARFESFNFDEDKKFQSGLSKIESKHTGGGRKKDLVKIKAFYYSRNVEPFEYATYVRWKESQACREVKLQGDSSLKVADTQNSEDQSDTPSKEVLSGSLSDNVCTDLGTNECSAVSSDISSSHCTDVSNSEQMQHTLLVSDSSTSNNDLSFAEIAELIQEEKPIPGLVQMDVVATNLPPTPSSIPRAKKPWEE
ncbi:hypothetical protein BaRGS_00020308 [Batillaria attramentaria]|uniref:Uncharacterized protein n=1 Tax=Batillaria attramentaria TaxID=370345 RepID=A0ABD0KNB9_9CAEN